MGLILLGGIVGFLLPTNQRVACMCMGLALGGVIAGGVILTTPKASTCFKQASGLGYLTFNTLKTCDRT